jgi:hypothetical protein
LIETVRRLAHDHVADGAVDWQKLAQPENYLGQADQIVDAVLKHVERILT